MWQMLTGASENQKLIEDFPVLLTKVRLVVLNSLLMFVFMLF